MFSPDAYSEERKKNALSAKTKVEGDKALRPKTKEVWKNAPYDEKYAIWDYTRGSGGFNRPLRGYEGSWYNFKGIGNVDLNHEGKAKEIEQMTKIINKSSLDQDTWLVRGVDNSGMAGFLGIDENVLCSSSEEELKKILLDKEVVDPAFMSCGSASGTGFGANIKIYCPKGTKAMYAEPFSYYGNGGDLQWDGEEDQKHFGGEFETIIQRGTKFRVTKVEKEYGEVKIEIEVIGQENF